MGGNDWKSLFKSVAPAIGTALGGPLGGAAAAFLADKLGVETKTVEAVTEVLNSGKLTPEQIENVKLADIEFRKFLETNKIDMAKLDVDNTKDARDMQKTTRSSYPAWLSTLVTFGFFGILAAMFVYPEVKESAPLMIMLGALGSAFASVVNFWLGSSHGSTIKTDALVRK